MKERFATDPLDPDRLYEKYSWTSNRVFEHKVVAIRSKLDGKTTLEVLPDSVPVKEGENVTLIKSYAEGELLYVTGEGNEIEHVNRARSGLINQRVEIPEYPNMRVSIPGKYRIKTDSQQ